MPVFAFTPGIPLATDIPAQSQPTIAQNFTSINDWTGEDHFEFASTNAGLHKQVSFATSASDPAAVADFIKLYTKDYNGSPEIFYRREFGEIINCTAASLANTGWAFLPNGLLMKWGFITSGAAGGVGTYTYQTGAGIPAFSAVYNVQITPQRLDGTNDPNIFVTLRTSATTNFTIYASRRTSTTDMQASFYYLSIGTPA